MTPPKRGTMGHTNRIWTPVPTNGRHYHCPTRQSAASRALTSASSTLPSIPPLSSAEGSDSESETDDWLRPSIFQVLAELGYNGMKAIDDLKQPSAVDTVLLGIEYITRGFEQLGYIEKGRYPIGVLHTIFSSHSLFGIRRTIHSGQPSTHT